MECCDVLGHVGCCWLKFETSGQIFVFAVVVVWPGSCNNVAPGYAN